MHGKSDTEKAASAKALAERNRHYNRLHSLHTIAWLESEESARKLSSEEHRILALHRRHVEEGHFMLGRWDFVEDAEYLAELDEFEKQMTA